MIFESNLDLKNFLKSDLKFILFGFSCGRVAWIKRWDFQFLGKNPIEQIKKKRRFLRGHSLLVMMKEVFFWKKSKKKNCSNLFLFKTVLPIGNSIFPQSCGKDFQTSHSDFSEKSQIFLGRGMTEKISWISAKSKSSMGIGRLLQTGLPDLSPEFQTLSVILSKKSDIPLKKHGTTYF